MVHARYAPFWNEVKILKKKDFPKNPLDREVEALKKKLPRRMKDALNSLDSDTKALEEKIDKHIPYEEKFSGLSQEDSWARAATGGIRQTGEWGPEHKDFAHTPNENLEGAPLDDEGNPQLNKKELLSRGWTKTAIDKFLGEPDRKRPTKYRRKTRLESLYDIERVLEAEATEEFREVLEESAYRAALAYYAPGIRVTAARLFEMPPGDRGKRDQLILQWHFVEGDTIEETAKRLALSSDSVELAKKRILRRPAFEKFFRSAQNAPGRLRLLNMGKRYL